MLEEPECAAPGARGAAAGGLSPALRGGGDAACAGRCGGGGGCGGGVGGRASGPRPGDRSLGPYNPEPVPCRPKGALFDVIVAAVIMYFCIRISFLWRFCNSSSF